MPFLGTAIAGLHSASGPSVICTLAAPADKLHNPIIVIVVRRREVPASVNDRDGLLVAGQLGNDSVSFLVVDHGIPHSDELAERRVDERRLIQPVIVAGSSHAACVQNAELERRVLQVLESLRIWHYRCVPRRVPHRLLVGPISDSSLLQHGCHHRSEDSALRERHDSIERSFALQHPGDQIQALEQSVWRILDVT